jgi:glyoxylase-like metal-dependent hydrolase (beta-lactamase superfamily II)
MFRLLHDEATGSMGYLLADAAEGEAVLIDPRGADVPALRALLCTHRLRLRWILRTHAHDALLLRESLALATLGATVIEHQPPHGMSGPLGFCREHVEVVATPGHTPGCLSFVWRDRMFCGGLMAADSCPHQPWPALPESMWDSVQRHVFSLPDETLLFGGHSLKARVVSTVKEQRMNHPWLAHASRETFLARARSAAASSYRRPHDSVLRLHH